HAPCHVPLSGLLTHCWCVPFFVIGVLADYGPPIAAVSIATLCHVPLSGLFTLLVVLADYGPPIAAARPLICHGPLYTASSCCCQVQSLSWVPVRPSHCCCLHRHTLPCATFRSLH
ncbi:unnamed protein product, partial [Staurois parvus]